LRKRDNLLIGEGVKRGEGGGGRGQVIQGRESLFLYKSFNTLEIHFADGSGRIKRGGGAEEAKLSDGEKAWSSINHSILSSEKNILCAPLMATV
jgi:hypothetical protein